MNKYYISKMDHPLFKDLFTIFRKNISEDPELEDFYRLVSSRYLEFRPIHEIKIREVKGLTVEMIIRMNDIEKIYFPYGYLDMSCNIKLNEQIRKLNMTNMLNLISSEDKELVMYVLNYLRNKDTLRTPSNCMHCNHLD